MRAMRGTHAREPNRLFGLSFGLRVRFRSERSPFVNCMYSIPRGVTPACVLAGAGHSVLLTDLVPMLVDYQDCAPKFH